MMFARSLEETYELGMPVWTFAMLFVPAILAFIFYRLSVRVAMRGRPKVSEGEDVICRA